MADDSIQRDKQPKDDQMSLSQTHKVQNANVREAIDKPVHDPPSLRDLLKDRIVQKYQAYSDSHLTAIDTHCGVSGTKEKSNGKDRDYSDDNSSENHLSYTGPKFLYELTEKVTKNIQTSLTDVSCDSEEEQTCEKFVEKADATVDNEEEMEAYSHMSFFDKRTQYDESEILSQMASSFKDLEEFVPNEQVFVYNFTRNHFDPSPRDDRYDLYDNMENYIRAKSYEFFGYMDDSFLSKDEELWKDKETEINENLVSGSSLKKRRKKKLKWDYFFKMPIITEEVNFIPPNEVKVLDASDESEQLVNFQPTDEVSYIQNRRQYGDKEESSSDEEKDTGKSYALSVRAAVQVKKETKVESSADDPRSILMNINVDKIDLPLTPTILLDPTYSTAAWIDEHYQIIPEYYEIKADATIQEHPTSSNSLNMGYSYYDLQRSNSSLDSVSSFTLSKNPLNKNTCHEDGHFLWVKSFLKPNIRSIQTTNLETN